VLQKISLNGVQIIFLRKLARKTWAYFEQFVTQKDNWLPPDNYQEHPVERIAHRTSPTNIGLSLMANLAAVDFGYITNGQFIERTTNTFNSLQQMERYKGHFYNWYDTITLGPLPPHYISTVDSGNLAGQLLTLRQGILSMPGQPIIGEQLFKGINDTVQILRTEIKSKNNIRAIQQTLNTILTMETFTLRSVSSQLSQLMSDVENLLAELNQLQDQQSPWPNALRSQCQHVQNELSLVTPWLALSPVPEKFAGLLDMDKVPDLV
jgi:FtsZ-binding cell division protein ZapB